MTIPEHKKLVVPGVIDEFLSPDDLYRLYLEVRRARNSCWFCLQPFPAKWDYMMADDRWRDLGLSQRAVSCLPCLVQHAKNRGSPLKLTDFPDVLVNRENHAYICNKLDL